MNRKIVLATIFPVTFFLILLGVKIPDVKDNFRPKPRPRAVLENVEKTSKETKETCSAPLPDIEPYATVSVVPLKPEFSFCTMATSPCTARVVDFSLSRAPPCFLS